MCVLTPLAFSGVIGSFVNIIGIIEHYTLNDYNGLAYGRADHGH